MNRIMQADVILTLTREQAKWVLDSVGLTAAFSEHDCPNDYEAWDAIHRLVAEQCLKQGVKP